MFTAIPNDMAEWILTHNMQDWKREIKNLNEVLNINAMLSDDDISTIVSPAFYDDIHTEGLLLVQVLDSHGLDHLYGERNTFITLHNLYNN